MALAFSRAKSIKDGLRIQLRRNKTKAINHAKGKMGTIDKEWKLQHQPLILKQMHESYYVAWQTRLFSFVYVIFY